MILKVNDFIDNSIFIIALWCNGNTADFGSVIIGSNPIKATTLHGVNSFGLIMELQVVVLMILSLVVFLKIKLLIRSLCITE